MSSSADQPGGSFDFAAQVASMQEMMKKFSVTGSEPAVESADEKEDSSSTTAPMFDPLAMMQGAQTMFTQNIGTFAAMQQMQESFADGWVNALSEAGMLGATSEPEFDPTSKLTVAQQWIVGLSALFAFSNDAVLNNVALNIEKYEAQQLVATSWGIESVADVPETIDRLFTWGHRGYFDAIVAAEAKLKTSSKIRQTLATLDGEFGLEDGSMDAYYRRHKAALRFLRAGDVLSDSENVTSIDAWDYGRVVLLLRLLSTAGYVEAEEFWETATRAAVAAQAKYESWEQYSLAYLYGRYFWGGDFVVDMDEHLDAHKVLLAHERSPYRLPWRTDLA